jgi:hypothetical protein
MDVNGDLVISGDGTEGGYGILNTSDPAFQVNLLGNSGFGVWSNSEDLYDAGTGAVPVVTGADAALVAGGSLVTNGGFDSATTGWSAHASCTIASVAGGQTNNCVQLTVVSGSLQYFNQAVTTVVGKLYELSGYVKSGTAGDVTYRVDIDGVSSAITGTSSGSWVQFSIIYEATATDANVTLAKSNATAGTMLFDTITLNEVTPGIVSATANGPDSYKKSGAAAFKVYREHSGSNTKDGSFYAAKITQIGDTGGGMTWPLDGTSLTHLEKFAGRTVTFGAWIKSDVASSSRLRIYDGTDSTYSSYHTGTSGIFEWLEVTATISSTPTNVLFTFILALDNTTEFVSQPQLSFCSSLGEGNYVAPVGEWVNCDGELALLSQTSISANFDMNVEAYTNGKVPKGALAVKLSFNGQAGTVGSAFQVYPTGQSALYGINTCGFTTADYTRVSGDSALSSDGEITIARTNTWTNNTMNIRAVQVS